MSGAKGLAARDPFAAFPERMATFDDPLTMRHTRFFAQPIALVWQAVSEAKHVNRWLIREAKIEPKLGGRCSFTWGGTTEQVGRISVYEPPRAICYDLGTSYLRFELSEVSGGTELVLLHHFSPGEHLEPQGWNNADQPAGAASPWRPGFSMGFHRMLDVLGFYLDTVSGVVGDAFLLHPGEGLLEWNARVGADRPELVARETDAYRRHIRESVGRRTVVLTRTFEAPRDLVFRMWTEPKHFAAWWGPAHNRNSACELDPRPGGAIRIQMTGQDYDNAMGGEFVEVNPPKRLVYIARGVPDEAGRWQVENHNTVTFEETDGVTTMTFLSVVTHIAPAIEEALDFMATGMDQSFDKLAALVAAEK